MMGVILYHVLLADELAEVRYYRLRDEIRTGLEALTTPKEPLTDEPKEA